MDFDPNAASGERNRAGPRWYSRVAFFVIALLLLLNAFAMFANAEANSEQACWAKVNAMADSYSFSPQNRTDSSAGTLRLAVNDCRDRFPND